MEQIIIWLLKHYPSICKEMIECRHDAGLQSPNPYHIEGDCWSHTMMVCKVAEIEKYSKTVQTAALLHDIGKPAVRRVNSKNGHVQFFGHEVLSAYLSIGVLYKMLEDEMIDKSEFSEIFALISLHSLLYKEKKSDLLTDKFKYDRERYLRLLELSRCDRIGRFCEEGFCADEMLQRFEVLADEMFDGEKKPKSNAPRIEILCGVSNSGKSTWLAEQTENKAETIVISRDALVLKYGNGKSYTNSWESLDEKAHRSIDTAIDRQYKEAVSEKKNIIVDMTNLSVKARKRWLSALPKIYFSRIHIFLTPLELIKERAQAQSETKKIDAEVIDGMVSRFEHPLYDEADSIVYEFIK